MVLRLRQHNIGYTADGRKVEVVSIFAIEDNNIDALNRHGPMQ